MLYLIGGAARSGKTLLARRLLVERRTPCFSLDYLTSGLARGAPELRVTHELSSRVRAERIWPVAQGILRSIVEVEPEYVVEGDALLPEHVAEFARGYSEQVRACFLGYARSDLNAKRAAMRARPSSVNDWTSGWSEEQISELLAEMKEFSAFLEAECWRLHIRYYDGSVDLDSALAEAYRYLVFGT